MLSDLFKEHFYNIKIARMFGLQAAVYLSAVLKYDGVNNIVRDNIDFIVINRDNIKNITTLDIEQQKNIDNIFIGIGLFFITSIDNEINIDYSILISLYNEINEDISKSIVPKIIKKRTKSDVIKDELKSYIKTDNGELRDAYASWIDAVFAKQGWMSKKSVELGQKLIDNYCNHNLDLAIELLNIASIGGYRDIQWAINSYEEELKKKLAKTNIVFNKDIEPKKKIVLAQEVF